MRAGLLHLLVWMANSSSTCAMALVWKAVSVRSDADGGMDKDGCRRPHA